MGNIKITEEEFDRLSTKAKCNEIRVGDRKGTKLIDI